VYLLVTKAEATLMRYDPAPNLGRLVQPRHYDGLVKTNRNGRVWAADNDCFQQLDPDAYRKMLHTIPTDGCKFVTAPDVVGDHKATLARWSRWSPLLSRLGFPAAFVIQDGCHTFRQVPDDASAVFIGGTTRYKLSTVAQQITADAKAAGRWVHMGRVNTVRRIQLAQSWGCDSIDGTSFSMFSDTYIPRALRMLAGPSPMTFDLGGAA
jgi:hypothetical protein